MRISFSRLLMIFLGIGVCVASHSYGQEKEEPKKTPFQETADSVSCSCAMHIVGYGHFPHFTSWGRYKWENTEIEFQNRIKSFPEDLLKALIDRESANQESALEFLVLYVALARYHTTHFISKNASEKDLARATDFALSPYSAKIKETLVANSMTKSAKMRLNAAAVLLASLDSSGRRSQQRRFKVGVASANQEIMTRINLISAWATGPSPQAVDNLGQMLSHHDKSVREAAAGAIIQMGTSARDFQRPALIKLLPRPVKTRKVSIFTNSAIALPRTGNLASWSLLKS